MTAEHPHAPGLDSLRKQAKQWLKALRSGDVAARERFVRAHPAPPGTPGLRDVQHALARELGFASWPRLKAQLEARDAERRGASQPPLQTLFEAAAKGDVDRVKTVLDAHPDLVNERGEAPGSFGHRTALHYGVEHAAVVKLLLERGADPNIRDDGDNAMPLHFAAEHQALEVIRLLVEHGADTVGENTMHELDVLGWAVAWDYIEGRKEVADYLLAHGARYSIFSAVALGAVEAIRDIAARHPEEIDRPMDATNHRRRPLHLAIKKQQRVALEVLLDLGADMEARDRAGLTPLDQAALAGLPDYAQLLIDRGARLELPAAVALGRAADIERLLAADPDCVKPGGRWGTLIVRAAERAPAHVIETLLRLGASPNAVDEVETAVDRSKGITPLHWAAFRGNADAVRVLLAHGANPASREGRHGATPLGWAEYANQEATQRLLADAPLDIFDAIVVGRETRVVEILDADPHALHRTHGQVTGLENDESFATPLVWAVCHNKPSIVRLLMERGAHVIEAPDGETLLERAVEDGFDEVAALLRGQASTAPPEPAIWAEAERAVRAGTVEALERLLKRHDILFRTQHPPAVTPGGLGPDYSAMDAREIIRRNHEFASWEAYVAFARQMKVAMSLETRVEAAADAIVNGQIDELRWLLRTYPGLVHERSTRQHHATLLHYTGPNGIEYFRQLTPVNAPDIVRLLLAAGADVNATADMYGGGATVLGLAATSVTPQVAGVVEPLLAALIDGGASLAPDGGALVNGCLRNGRLAAASYLASRGAEVDLEAAAGVGQLDLVRACFDERGNLKPPSTPQQMLDGFAWACEFGHRDVVRFLLERGVDVATKVKHHGQTGLHWAAGGGHVDTVAELLRHGAPVGARDDEWGGTPLQWAFHGYSDRNQPPGVPAARYYQVIRQLVAAGAVVEPEWLEQEAVRADPQLLAALGGAAP